MSRSRKSANSPGCSAALLEKALIRFSNKLFIDGASRELFKQAILKASAAVPARVWIDCAAAQSDSQETANWCPAWVSIIPPAQVDSPQSQQPEGNYYQLDLSSVFCAVPLLSVNFEDPIVLDMCAAPGGKAILAWKALRPKAIICNEVIAKRHPALISNLKRCRISHAYVTQSDSSWFANNSDLRADVVIVDAPCSGQSLLARGQKSLGCFNPVAIRANSKRQRRILANAARAVTPGGSILYSTCTFSAEENEQNIAWFMKKFSGFRACKVESLEGYQSEFSAIPCYRLWPWMGLGAGGFTCLLKSDLPREYGRFEPGEMRFRWSQP